MSENLSEAKFWTLKFFQAFLLNQQLNTMELSLDMQKQQNLKLKNLRKLTKAQYFGKFRANTFRQLAIRPKFRETVLG